MSDGLAQSGFLLQAVVAFGGGIMSFVSPCVLPLVPGYVAMIGGESVVEGGRSHRRRTLGRIGLFVVGFTIVFAALGASASTVSIILRRHLPDLTRLAGGVIVAVGLLIVLMAYTTRGPLAFLNRERRPDVRPGRLGSWAPVALGMAFAFGWTPCIGPILAVVLATTSTQDTVGRGVGLLVAYSLGLGIPFLLAGLGMDRVFGRLRRWARALQVASGLALAGFGVVMLTGSLRVWSNWLSRWFLEVPVLQRLAEI